MSKTFKTIFGLVGLLMLTAGFASCSSEKEEQEPDPVPSKANFTKRYNAGLTFFSNVLQQQISYDMLLPEEYLKNDGTNFDVMYLFHGYGDKPSSWDSQHFDLQKVDAQARAAGKIRPIIYVMPQGFNSYYVNRFDGKFNYMDMLVKELVPLIDKMLRTTATARGRAVGGYSMGGFGALAVASLNPTVFGTCVALSPSLNTDEQYRTLGAWDSQWGSVFGGVGSFGDARITSTYRKYCPLHFFAENPSQFASVNYYIDCGDDEERLYIGNGELHSLMREKGIRHEYRVRNGAHTTAYWRDGLLEGLAVFEATLSGASYPECEETPLPAKPAVTKKVTSDGVTLITGSGYKGNASTHMIYLSAMLPIDADAAAQGLADQLNTRNCALAFVNTENWSDTAHDAERMFRSAEQELGLTVADNHRHLMVYGKGFNALVPYAFSGANVGGLYVEDSDILIPDNAKCNGRTYVLDLGDMAANHRPMFNIFCTMREANAPAQYRVRNGNGSLDDLIRGISSLSTFMNIPVN